MTENFNVPQSGVNNDEYESVNREQIELARAAGNVWTFEGREMEMYVAQGKSAVAVKSSLWAKRRASGANMQRLPLSEL